MGKIITVDFRQDTLFAIERDDGVFLAIKPICDALGLKWSGQHDRINRDPILSEGIRVMGMPTPGGTQETTCLRLDLVNGWLFTIDESRVKDEETRQKVLAYKRECHAVLFRHFYGKAEAPEALEPKPWAERPLEERRAELATAHSIGRYGNHALAWWYLAEVAHVANFPRQLLPVWHQEQLNLGPLPQEIVVAGQLN